MESIVVGVDESAGAAEALRWAARESQLRSWPLTAVMCWGYLAQHGATPDRPFDPSYTPADAQAALDAIVDRVLGDGAATVKRHTVNDLPARGLLESSSGADLLVVGARGLGAFRRLLLGSVSQACLQHAEIPVAIVRAPTTPRPMGHERLVVGIDGSDTSQRALEWALDEARLRQAAIEVVHAWHPPLLRVPVLEDPYGPFEDLARSVVDTALELADVSGLPAPVRTTIRAGSGGSVLIDAAEEADLVIVGSRGLGGFKGLLLGSVSYQVTHHASCPVVVIPHVHATAQAAERVVG
jgi:nucleotide-binding universal stress UspA family protein